ncbi:hypothetical protein [Amycolatopsis nivea]|uniref:hypothetical protein n=1 Tax=Amycolatopsis nivea TaxID=1644109 RepID=UPI00106F109A|nr:hypothetical protein [Amycolatopsis nivea]
MEFAVADDEVWLSAFDTLPQWEDASGDSYVRELKIPVSETGELHLSWDPVERSVRLRYRQGSDVVVDVFREQATVLTIHQPGPIIAVEYRAEDCLGRMRVQLQPTFALDDVFLRT